MVVLSTTEVEYMAATHACKVVWLKRLLGDNGVYQKKVIVHRDSQSALHLVRNTICHACTKHIDVQHHFARNGMEDEVSLHKIHTYVTDKLSNLVASEKFLKCRIFPGLVT